MENEIVEKQSNSIRRQFIAAFALYFSVIQRVRETDWFTSEPLY